MHFWYAAARSSCPQFFAFALRVLTPGPEHADSVCQYKDEVCLALLFTLCGEAAYLHRLVAQTELRMRDPCMCVFMCIADACCRHDMKMVF
jgi:hypothetical protein